MPKPPSKREAVASTSMPSEPRVIDVESRDLVPSPASTGEIAEAVSRPAMSDKKLSVGVLVDLPYSNDAGGHVKCWERFAEASQSFASQIDLTVYFLGKSEQVIDVSFNARYVLLPPQFGTDRLPFLKQGAGDTDLAKFHKGLAGYLPRHDVLHATSAFSFSKTARAVAAEAGIAFMSSIHTDLPKFTEIYTREIVENSLGRNALSRLLLDRIGVADRAARSMERTLIGLLSASERVLVSKDEDWRRLTPLLGGDRLGRLRRGVDRDMFHPKHRNRSKLAVTFGVPEDVPVVMFAGRVDESKRVMTLALAARRLIDAGRKLHVLIVGQGAAMDSVRRVLGPNVTLPGPVSREDLSWIYPSCDLFVFPSESDVMPNVVLEAKASGLPVVVSANDGAAQFVSESGKDGILVADRAPEAWAAAMAPLIVDGVRRAEIAYAARKMIDEHWPSWTDVFRDDLLNVWRTLAARRTTRAL